MANYERDKDNARVFDGGYDDEAEGSHLPVVIIIAILVLAAFGGVVWLAYNQGLARGRSDVPVQLASNDTSKDGQIKVYQQPAGNEDAEDVQSVTANPQTGEPAAPKPEASAPEASHPSQMAAVPTPAPANATPAVAPKPAAATVALRPSNTGASVAASAPKPATMTVTKSVVAATPKPVKFAQATPLPTSAVKPQTPPPAAATKAPAQLGLAHPAESSATALSKSAATPKPVAAVAPVASKPVAAGSYLLQIGAYKSQDEAMAAWKTFQAKHTPLLRGFSPDVQRADLGEKGIWYRLRVASFADKSAANALCDKLKADNGACFLAR